MTDSLLFVDDQTMLATLMEMEFSEAGIRSKIANDAETALNLIKRDKKHEIKVVFTDIHLPENDGWWLIAEASKVRKDLRFMVISADIDSREKGKTLVADGKIFAYFDKGGISHSKLIEKCKNAMLGLK